MPNVNMPKWEHCNRIEEKGFGGAAYLSGTAACASVSVVVNVRSNSIVLYTESLGYYIQILEARFPLL